MPRPIEYDEAGKPLRCAYCGEYWPCSDRQRLDIRPDLRALHGLVPLPRGGAMNGLPVQSAHASQSMDYWNDARGLQEDCERAREQYRLARQWATALEESGAGSPEDIRSAWETVTLMDRAAASLYASAARAAARGAR